MTNELQRKVDRAVKLIQAAGKVAKEHGQPLEVCYSGGKDSDVILELARMSGADIRPIYKNTATSSCISMKTGCRRVSPSMTRGRWQGQGNVCATSHASEGKASK